MASGAYWAFFLPRASPKASAISGPLELSLALDKTEYGAGENISITYVLKNVGGENITLTFGEGCYYYDEALHYHGRVFCDYIINDSNGTEVFRWSNQTGATLALVVINMAPGEQRNNTFTFTFDKPYYYYYGCKLDPGVYRIRGIVPPGSLGTVGIISGGIHSSIRLETPSIAFTVR